MINEIQKFKNKLQQVTKYALNNNTLGEFYNSAYEFVEFIEKHTVLGKLVKDEINSHLDLRADLSNRLKTGEIDKETFYQLFSLHVTPHFWFNNYGCIKNHHDVVKVDKCALTGIEPDNVDSFGLFIHRCADVDFTKPLSEIQIKSEMSVLNGAQNEIMKLIDSNSELFASEYNQKKSSDAINYTFDEIDNKGTLFIKEKEIEFSGSRALIIKYYFDMKDLTPDYLTYIDFNKAKKVVMDSIAFRQSIDKINDRVKKEIGHISQIIGMKSKNKEKEINQYCWEIKR